ncbi:hypothetical protein [Actinoplanes subglobosus]|uniref:Uncharacterized protein n=1 Tax=Actinoplanes subglobosus TaxID=1547892 RepID=A0ABV8J287_9ACTN
MIRIVGAEVLKLVTLPSIGLTVAMTCAITAILGQIGSPLPYAQVGVLVLGVLAAGHEYQGGGQIRSALLAVPRRSVLVTAKFAAVTIAAGPAVLVVALLAGEPGATGRLLLDLLLAAGVATIVRHPVGATAILLTAYEIVVPLIVAHLPRVALPPGPVWPAAMMVTALVVVRCRDA